MTEKIENNTAGEEYMPQLRANAARGSGFIMENFFCSSDTFNFWSARSNDYLKIPANKIINED